jgi:hypothetical protein
VYQADSSAYLLKRRMTAVGAQTALLVFAVGLLAATWAATAALWRKEGGAIAT